jgi:hypothetical protein
MSKTEIIIQFDVNKLGDEGMEKLHQIEKLFMEMGITFDTGFGFGYRDWQWDWSLKGPVKSSLARRHKCTKKF